MSASFNHRPACADIFVLLKLDRFGYAPIEGARRSLLACCGGRPHALALNFALHQPFDTRHLPGGLSLHARPPHFESR